MNNDKLDNVINGQLIGVTKDFKAVYVSVIGDTLYLGVNDDTCCGEKHTDLNTAIKCFNRHYPAQPVILINDWVKQQQQQQSLQDERQHVIKGSRIPEPWILISTKVPVINQKIDVLRCQYDVVRNLILYNRCTNYLYVSSRDNYTEGLTTWVAGENQNIIAWMPLPLMPITFTEEEEDVS